MKQKFISLALAVMLLLGNGPGQRVCELLQLLSVRQPVFLAHPAAALSVDTLGHGANALP